MYTNEFETKEKEKITWTKKLTATGDFSDKNGM